MQAAQVGALRAALLAYLRQLTLSPKTSWLLPIIATHPQTGPSLLLLRETLYQVCRERAQGCWEASYDHGLVKGCILCAERPMPLS